MATRMRRCEGLRPSRTSGNARLTITLMGVCQVAFLQFLFDRQLDELALRGKVACAAVFISAIGAGRENVVRSVGVVPSVDKSQSLCGEFWQAAEFLSGFFPGQKSLILSRAGGKRPAISRAGSKLGGTNGLNLRPVGAGFVRVFCASKIGVRHGVNPNEKIYPILPRLTIG